MALSPGTVFGEYEIIDALGAGGMGEVYRARDKRLERDVAIKVLPASFSNDADRVARFEQEAKTLAALNHPNIAHIYGIETVAAESIAGNDASAESPTVKSRDRITALVMELVDGPTLAERIAEGPLPADEAMTIAMQIANALEAAHERGIVHRDLKPANVKLTANGTVKVLDFGIAKAIAPELTDSGGASPMLTTPATQIGVILGTAAYMSPEQARGKRVDQRTDIWAFGCVLYEMLTGQLAFGGEDVAVTLARVIANDTDLDSLPASISPAVQRTIELCLRKDPTKRVADIRDVKLALAGEFETIGHAVHSAAGVDTTIPLSRRPLPAAAAALVLGVLIAGVAAFVLQPAPEPPPLNRFSYRLPEGMDTNRQGENVLAVSPDGRHFVINTQDGLYLRALDTLEGRLIPGTAEDIAAPFFSPDGQSVAYWAAPGQIKRIGIVGGAAVVVSDADSNAPHGGYWAADGTIFITEDRGISRVPATGGARELVVPTDPGQNFNGVQLLDDEDTLLFSVAVGSSWDSASIVAHSLSTGERSLLIEGGSSAQYVDTGHLVYALSGGLFAIPFDPGTLTVSGGVVPAVQGVARAYLPLSGLANYGIADDGTLIYLTGDTESFVNVGFEYSWVDDDGREEALGLDRCVCSSPSVSPDGARIVMGEFEFGFAQGDIWIWSIPQQTFTRLTFEPGMERSPVWSPDSTRIAYGSRDGLFVRRADGTGTPERLLDSPEAIPYSWSADGEIIYSIASDAIENQDIGVIAADGSADTRMLLATTFDENRPALSPDGRWLAYQSSESGRSEIYVRPYPDVDAGRWQVSTGGGWMPQWSADSSRLFFASDEAVSATRVEAGSGFVFSTPRPVFDINGYLRMPIQPRDYAVSLDGDRVLLATVEGMGNFTSANNNSFVIVQNWTEELKRLAPTE